MIKDHSLPFVPFSYQLLHQTGEGSGARVPTEKKDGAGEKLIYILSHKDKEVGAAAFKAFRSDPDWVKVKTESEVDGSLTVKDGIQSVLMTATDFSPTK